MKQINSVKIGKWEGVKFFLDSPKVQKALENKYLCQGWLVAVEPIKHCYLISSKGVKQNVDFNVHRPRVKDLYPNYNNCECAGFEFEVDANVFFDAELRVDLASGKSYCLAKIDVGERSDKKLIYVHIPKTAGSTLNKFISSRVGTENSLTHIESNSLWPKAASEHEITGKQFLSGHLSYFQFKRHLEVTNYYKLITFRDPVAHMISHLAWIRHFSDPGFEQQLLAHPDYIRSLSKDLSIIDFQEAGDLKGVIENLNELQYDLLDNTQTRYLVEKEMMGSVTEQSYLYAINQLDEFDRIGFIESYDSFVALLCDDMGWEAPARVKKTNEAVSKYGFDINNAEIINVIEPLIHWDLKLYQAAKSRH